MLSAVRCGVSPSRPLCVCVCVQMFLSPMVRVPACCAVLSFGNKRLYFRDQLAKLLTSESRYGTIGLTVRRDHLFEDSYERLRNLSAEEMRGKIVVTFEGEKGADAGGLRREWYR